LLLHFGPQVVALDISEGALARARTRAQRYSLPYTLVAGDAERLPFPDDAFDYAFVHDGLHHLDDTTGAIAEMVRVSKRGIMITEPADAQLTHLATRLGIITELEDSGNEVNRLHPDRLRPVFEQLGMPIVRHQRYLVKYQHQPAWYSRLLDLPGVYPLAREAFLVLGVKVLGSLGNKLAIVALAPDERHGAGASV
jgi:SAM-dependent methyltransferase